MTVHTSGNSSADSAGANALTITVIIGSVLLLLGALAAPIAGQTQTATPTAKQAHEQVVVTATKAHRVL